jgi:hypothetical protein
MNGIVPVRAEPGPSRTTNGIVPVRAEPGPSRTTIATVSDSNGE